MLVVAGLFGFWAGGAAVASLGGIVVYTVDDDGQEQRVPKWLCCFAWPLFVLVGEQVER